MLRLSNSENIAKGLLEKRGLRVFKTPKILPDFICINKKKEIIFYEIKSNSNWRLTKGQQIIFKKMHMGGNKIKIMMIRKGGFKLENWYGKNIKIKGVKYGFVELDYIYNDFKI